jgi:hypothetical protein
MEGKKFPLLKMPFELSRCWLAGKKALRRRARPVVMSHPWLQIIFCCVIALGVPYSATHAEPASGERNEPFLEAIDGPQLSLGSEPRGPDSATKDSDKLASGNKDPNLDPCPISARPGEASETDIFKLTSLTTASCERSSSSDGVPPFADEVRAKIQWGSILKQSFNFLVFEHAFRIASDGYTRRLLFHRPFWQDWANSIQHYDMNQWGDGDSFLVNYIGHPMEGAVAGNIFIQNDPRERLARFGKSSTYWKSRLKAMGWAALYSAYFEAGPVLSEAAIGNEGGYTYVPGCGWAPCSKLGVHLKPATNNTGWVDFVVTPTVGIGWMVLEDAIEREIIDRLAGDSPALAWKIVRGSLAPTHTVANFMQWKVPWYRPWLSNDPTAAQKTVHAPAPSGAGEEAAPSWKDQPRKAFGLHYVNLNIPLDWNGCNKCRISISGFGMTASYRLTRRFWLDTELNHFPGSGSQSGRGSVTEGLLGIRYGYTGRVWNFYAKIAPGFIYYPKTTSYPTGGAYVTVSRFALSCGTVLERKVSERSAFRFDVGTTFVRYLQGLDPQQPPVAVISANYIATQGNFQFATGYIFRF